MALQAKPFAVDESSVGRHKKGKANAKSCSRDGKRETLCGNGKPVRKHETPKPNRRRETGRGSGCRKASVKRRLGKGRKERGNEVRNAKMGARAFL